MKYLIIIALLCISMNSYASLNDVDKTQIWNKNILSNPGFEHGKAAWTASGGTFAVTTSSPMIGKVHATWDSSGAAQTLTSTAVAIPAGMLGRNGAASCLITVASGTATHTLEAYDGTNILASANITSNTAPTRTSVNFIFPSSGSISIRLVSVAAGEPSIAIDDCYHGPTEGYNLGLAKPQDVFSAKISSTDVVSDENIDWITGNCTNAGTGLATCIIPAHIFNGAIPNCTATSTAATRKIHYLYASSTSTSLEFAAADTSGALNPSSFDVICQKTGVGALQDAYTPDVLANSWTGYHALACQWARTNAAYGNPTADACSLTEVLNTNFGAVTSYLSGADLLPGIVFTPKKAQKYFVKASFKAVIGSGTSTNVNFKMSDGTTTIEELSLQSTDTSDDFAVTMSGIYSATSTNAVTLRIESAAATGSITIGGGGIGRSSIEWSIFAIDQSLPTPTLTGSVVTLPTNSVYRILSATVTGSDDSVSLESGDWINGACTNATAGLSTCNINSGVFSATPNCFCTPLSSANVDCTIYSISSSSFIVRNFSSATGSGNNNDFMLFCMGLP